MSNSAGLVDFAIRLLNAVLKLPKGHVKLYGKFKLQKSYNQCCSSKVYLGYLKDSWASTYWQQLARMASRKTDFLCTLLVCPIQFLLMTFATSEFSSLPISAVSFKHRFTMLTEDVTPSKYLNIWFSASSADKSPPGHHKNLNASQSLGSTLNWWNIDCISATVPTVSCRKNVKTWTLQQLLVQRRVLKLASTIKHNSKLFRF